MLSKNLKIKIFVLALGLFFSIFCFELLLNFMGIYYSARDSGKRETNDEVVIQTIGNSYTFGVGAPKGKSYPDYLEKFLNQNQKNKKYRVINHGIISSNTIILLEQMHKWFKEDRPDFVFLMVGEPNHWNKFGYWKIHNSLQGGGGFQDEFLNVLNRFLEKFKSYQLIRFLISRDFKSETSNDLASHSVLFKDVKLQSKNNLFLGYLWLTALNSNVLVKISEMNQLQFNEAEKYLKYVFEEDRNYFAGVLLSQINRNNKNFIKGLHYLERSLEFANRFDLKIWSEVENYKFSTDKKVLEKQKQLSSLLNAKINKVELSNILKYFDPKSDVISFSFKSKSEEIRVLQLIQKYNPIYFASAHYLLSKEILENGIFNTHISEKGQKYAVKIMEDFLKIIPLSFDHDFFIDYNIFVSHYPNYKMHYDTLINQVKSKIGHENVAGFFEIEQLEKKWLFHDLDKMVEISLRNGAKVVIQTYPPLRDNSSRETDYFLREWWEIRQKRLNKKNENLFFSDVGLLLTSLFDVKQGGEKFYTTWFGNMDSHQSELGNIEIAKTMLPYFHDK